MVNNHLRDKREVTSTSVLDNSNGIIMFTILWGSLWHPECPSIKGKSSSSPSINIAPPELPAKSQRSIATISLTSSSSNLKAQNRAPRTELMWISERPSYTYYGEKASLPLMSIFVMEFLTQTTWKNTKNQNPQTRRAEWTRGLQLPPRYAKSL